MAKNIHNQFKFNKKFLKKITDLFVDEWNFFFSDDFPISKNILNNGWCYQYAFLIKLIFDDVSIFRNDDHVFIEHNGYFYDAINTKGIHKNDSIGTIFESPIQATLDDIYNDWRHGYSGKIDEKFLKKCAKKFTKRLKLKKN